MTGIRLATNNKTQPWTPSISRMASTSKSSDIFGPSVIVTNPMTSSKDSTKDVTHPELPQLFDPSFLDALLPERPIAAKSATDASTATLSGAAFMAALKEEGNKQYTANAAHGFKSTASPTVDAFNGLSQATDPADFEPLLRKSWQEDPLLTVKMIFNLRSIHEGKSEREGFYRAWGWLYRTHPRTAIVNLPALVDPLIERKLKEKEKKRDSKDDPKAEEDDGVLVDFEDAETKTIRGMTHGYWKDLLNLLLLASAGQLDDGLSKFTALHPERTPRRNPRPHKSRVRRPKPKTERKTENTSGRKSSKDPQTQQERIAASLKRDEENAAKAKAARAEAHANSRDKIQKLLEKSSSFKALYITVARLFADQLESDVEVLEKIADPTTKDKQRINLSFQLSLAAKYAPSITTTHDRATNIASAVAELLWAKGKLRLPYDPSQALQPTVEKVLDLRIAYTRWVLSPLRRFLQIPEIYMSSNRWSEMPYKRVASTCMQKNKTLFYKHDETRFSKYLMDVAAGKRTISGGTLLPHSLLAEALSVKNAATDPAAKVDQQVIEAQWNTMVEKLRESGTLDNSIAVCDVSGSMGYIHRAVNGKYVSPILPAVALSIVLSQVSREPWANSFITFSGNPKIVQIDLTAGLVETATKIVGSDWGMNTNFNAIFTKLILPMAIRNKLPKEEMIKRLFVFSDMEFDSSIITDTGLQGGGSWATEHEQVASAFEAAGYDVPEIVYWNLQGARGAKPVEADWEGVSVMSGFSSNMLKVFMEDGTVEEDLEEVEVEEQVEGDDGMVVVIKKEKKKMTPEDVMKKALNKPSYSTLVVMD